ncbi:hypothetical protein EGR_09965 [Echinococcus granulosus]|uniref:Uncharacterized protein n=1 Tax=Echinococcus granulosus TaxID=6210 RepID=W6U293_ECHGR|nr:hypothetical protein EGR_09965 [Echinococcus granulosus]EUB55183.1 hypothetical protein EGR_09965 [Echinococcus granulosus]
MASGTQSVKVKFLSKSKRKVVSIVKLNNLKTKQALGSCKQEFQAANLTKAMFHEIPSKWEKEKFYFCEYELLDTFLVILKEVGLKHRSLFNDKNERDLPFLWRSNI